MSRDEAPGHVGAVVLAWGLLAIVFVAVAVPRAGSPGLYYDEAFFAQQAKDFFEPERGLHHPASTREIVVFGRPFPLRNAAYLGSLKSQLLIPSFALFGARVEVLRLTTAGTGLAALLLFMLWTNRLLGPVAACVGGALSVADPSCWFFSLYEWGPFTTLLLCRGAGLYFLTTGWLDRSLLRVAIGGLALGLGVFARADFAAVVAAIGLALLAVRPRIVAEAWHERRALLVALLASALLGAAPMLLSAGDLLQLMGSPVLSGRGDLGEKLRVLASLADGSRFYRIMETGGRFELMAGVDAPATLFALAALGAGLATLVRGARRLRRGLRPGVPEFLLLAGVLVTAATVALPGAVRAHHLLNAFPFFHLLVGATAAGLLARGPWARAGVAVALACVVVSDARVIAATYDLVERTGGRGRWTGATAEAARWLESEPRSRGVSLDWGFHEPLLFLTRRAHLVEPIWDVRSIARGRGRWRFPGRAGDLYLVHDGDYDHFGFGPPLLAAARELADAAPDAVELLPFRDREGGVAFWGVQLERRHHLVYQGRRFRFELREAAPRAPDPPAAPGDASSPERASARAAAKIRFPVALKWRSRLQ